MTIKIEGFEKFVALGKENAEAVAKSGAATVKAFEEITKAQQAVVARNVEQADAAVKAILAVKSPAELADLQGKLARESIEAAIADSRKLVELATAAFTTAFEPLNARFAAFQALTKTAA
ncbi:MAG: phasin family protein [Magnetospirillum sp.]|nr:MAG: phasin family protein [Magnetospirillum sp.]